MFVFHKRELRTTARKRYAPHNRLRANVSRNISFLFSGCRPSVYKNFPISFSWGEGKYGVFSALLRKRFVFEGKRDTIVSSN